MYSLADSVTDGFQTLTLSDSDADLHATIAPGIGMIVCSLRHRGDELLGQRHGLAAYAEKGSTMGIPLLHPWANRLSGLEYAVAGKRVRLDATSPLLHKDAGGLPMHGVLAAYSGWQLTQQAADTTGARVAARLDFGADPTLMTAFPFPHELTLAMALSDATLSVTTTLRANGGVAVPASFGFHPYLQLPHVARQDWFVAAPVRQRALLDSRMIPTGGREEYALQPGPLGDAVYDDLFTGLDRPARFVLAGGGRRVTVEFDDGFTCAQIYAPATDALICFEPMTALTNALVSGDGLRLVQPGAKLAASFSLRVETC